MLTTECCPQCRRQADSGPVRLVQDSCGHKKCRECLVKDETGCLQCSYDYMPVYTELTTAGACPATSISVDASSAPSTTPGTDDVIESAISYNQTVPIEDQDLQLCNVASSHSSCTPPAEKSDGPTLSEDIRSINVSKKTHCVGLKEHIIFTPGNPPKYSCKKCNKSYNNRKAARYHNYCGAPDTEKPHTCGECGQGFVTKGHLEYHMKTHTGALPFTCKVCGKGFKQVSKLNRHSKSHEGSSEKPFQCEICYKTFSTKQILKDHMLSHSKGHFVTCPTCSKKLSSQSCLRKHKKLHAEPTHKCKDCGKKFPVKWSLEVHMKTHQRERKFKCKECSRAFKIHSDLKRHGVVHQEDGEWECKNCLLIFRRRDNLVRHLKNLHPESPLIISMKQTDEKETDKQQNVEGKMKGSNPPTLSSVGQAVSVIRIAPVVQKVDASAVRSSSVLHHSTDSRTSVNDDTISETLQESLVYPLHNSLGFDQNLHRESVVCHSDARGVVHHGSTSCENVYDSRTTRTNINETSVQGPASGYQYPWCEEDASTSACEDDKSQSNLVCRPHVIVAKKTWL